MTRRRLYAGLAIATVLLVGVIIMASQGVRDGLTLIQCKVYGSPNVQAECVFSLIKQKMLHDGLGPALQMFLTASKLYPRGLDINCHAGIHRVGDLAYYNLFYNDPNVVDFPFPVETNICNRGFFHGIFEHLFQDRPDPAFIAETCNRLRANPHINVDSVPGTCFHASGHGLFRAQSERVPQSEWGVPAAFVDAPAKLCATLPNASSVDRHDCTTGVESIYIQSSLLGDYGLSNPDPWNPLKVCDLLAPSLHPTCYYVRALMVAEIDDGYQDILDDCYFASDTLFESCLRGVVIGLVVNGVSEHSYKKSIDLCVDPRVAERGLTTHCYQRVARQLTLEYWGEYTPECDAFPDAYRQVCEAERI